MSRVSTGLPETDKSLLSLLLGFLGVTATLLLLPKTVKYVIRRFFLGIVSEVVAVVITGLLTEKLVGMIGDQQVGEDLPEPPRHR